MRYSLSPPGAVSVKVSVTATADEVPPALVAVKLGVKLLAAHGMPLSIPVHGDASALWLRHFQSDEKPGF